MAYIVKKSGKVTSVSQATANKLVDAGEACQVIPDGFGGFHRVCSPGKKYMPKGFNVGGMGMINPPIHVTIGATKADVVTMQKTLQAIAKLSKNPAWAFTLAPGWADGIFGPSTTKAVNLIVRIPRGLKPGSTRVLKKYVLGITENALKIVKALQAKAASQKPAAPPKPPVVRQEEKKEERKALAEVQKSDEKVLAKTKVTSGILPITSDSYLKFYPANPVKKQAAGYKVYKKLPGRTPTQLGTVLVIEGLRKLKMSGKFSASTAVEIRRRVPKPWNTYEITLNGKKVAGRSTAPVKNPAPPVSPHVPPEAPPDATAADYSTPKTPQVVQKDVAEKQPPPKEVAPPTMPPDPQPSTPVVTKDEKTGKKKIKFPPVTITATPPAPPVRLLAKLPDVPETEKMLEEFFAQDLIAGIGAAPPRGKQKGLLHDTRFPGLGPMSFMKDPYGAVVQPKDIDITAGFDEMDDVDEELAEMQASGFSKGWW